MIRHVEKYYLKESVPNLHDSHLGATIPIFLSEDGQVMTLNPNSVQGTRLCWDLTIRTDENGHYCELPITDDEMTILLGKYLQNVA